MFWATQCTRALALLRSSAPAAAAAASTSSTLARISGVTSNWPRFTSKNQRLLASQLSAVAMTTLGAKSLASGCDGSCARSGTFLHHQA